MSLEADDMCYVCDREDNPDVLLVCDSCRFRCCHIYCCNPPMEAIPDEEWICSFCIAESELNDRSPRYNLRNTRSRNNRALLELLFDDDEGRNNRRRPQTRQSTRNARNNTNNRRGTDGRLIRDYNSNSTASNSAQRINRSRTQARVSVTENRSNRRRSNQNTRENSANRTNRRNVVSVARNLNRSRTGAAPR